MIFRRPNDPSQINATSAQLTDRMKGSPTEKKKKSKKRRSRRHSSSSSSSSSSQSSDSDSGHKKKKSPKNMDTGKTDEEALEKKKNILSKVWSLMGQKKKLEMQRDEIVLTHKGDGKSLAALLQENSNLSAEIDKQIFLMNQMVQLINDKLGISKIDGQQQEFYLHSKMFEDKTLPKTIGNMNKSSIEKSLNQFLKPEEVMKRKTKIKKSSSPEIPSKKMKKKKREKSPDDKEIFLAPSLPKGKMKPIEMVEEDTSHTIDPTIKYIDQGMHWCKECNDFFDTVYDYVAHLESSAHIETIKVCN